MQIKSWLLAGMLGGLAALGCGDDDGGGGGGSGVSGSKQINELTEAEFKKVCESVQKKLSSVEDSLNEAVCTAQGLAEAELSAADCEEVRDECLDNVEPDPEFNLDCDDPPDEMADDCDATVDDFEACADATVKAVDSWADDLTCSTDVEDIDGEGPDEPAACKKLNVACGLGGEESEE